MVVQNKIKQLFPFPNSWYTVGLSEELKPGNIQSLIFCGQELVLYRTQSGKAVLSEAFCPHMGAHFGKGGQIEGENLRCPFHGFCFDTDGKCVSNGYGTPVPPQAKISVWPIREQNGMIMAWHHSDGLPPDWTIPELETEGWTQFKFHTWELNSHPQEIAENSVDTGHFQHIHGYQNVKIFEAANTADHVLKGVYGMSRIANFIGKSGKLVDVKFEFEEHGLGYALIEPYVITFGLTSQHLVLPMPVDGSKIKLRIAVRLKLDFELAKIHPLLRIIPRNIMKWMLMDGYFREYKKDVSDDFEIWTNKKYVHPPALANGDGPIILYRKWAAQFYENQYIEVDSGQRVIN